MTRILIGALSGWKYRERRERCLATWMKDADELDIEAVFLLGCPVAVEPERVGLHSLACPCPDDYNSLPQRTRCFCRWALGLGERLEVRGERKMGGKASDLPSLTPNISHLSPFPWDYLFKCDDDTYVSIPRLVAYAKRELPGKDYVGAEWRPGVNYGSGGAGYFLSRNAAEIVANNLTQRSGAEDLLVGQLLRDAKIPFSIEPRLIPFGSMERRPKLENDLITLHGASVDAFLAAHGETSLAACRA